MSDAPTQGSRVGSNWPAEETAYTDPTTGARVRRLTDYPGSDNAHLYFTEPGWYGDGRRLLFRSDRTGTRELYSIDLETGLITQLTDLPGGIGGVTRSPVREEAYVWSDGHLLVLDLNTLETQSLYECPEGYSPSTAGGTADGERVATSISEDVSDRLDDDYEDREEWIAEILAMGPNSKVVSVSREGGDATVHVDEDTWIGHVNTSPTRPELLTYCHEGTWEAVDHRIWVLDVETDETWKVRECAEDEAVGHEYWLADGETVGYHGWRGDRDAPDAFFGQERFDGTDRREGWAPDVYTHYHSNTRDLVIGDGTHRGIPCNVVHRWNDDRGAYDGPWMLATHDWGGDDEPHPHSRLSPDGSTVVFDSGRAEGDSDVYLVEIPDDLEDLPPVDREFAPEG